MPEAVASPWGKPRLFIYFKEEGSNGGEADR